MIRKTTIRRLMVAGMGAALALLAQPAVAVPMPVQFLEIGTNPIGMDPNGFPMPADLPISTSATVLPVVAGPVTNGYGLGITNCFIINESPGAGCVGSQPFGSSGFSLIVDITLVSVPDIAVGQDSLIFFSALPPVPTYSVSDVSVIVTPDPLAGFTFTPFTTASFAPGTGMTYYYLGFILGQGESATFRVDVTGDHSAAGMPLAFAANGFVVPEPGTAVLLGAGLLMLARRRSR